MNPRGLRFEKPQPEILNFGQQKRINARLSLSRTEPVPFAHRMPKKRIRQDIASSAEMADDGGLTRDNPMSSFVSVQVEACTSAQRPAAFPQAVRSAPSAAGQAP
jgi:hypothetical protein